MMKVKVVASVYNVVTSNSMTLVDDSLSQDITRQIDILVAVWMIC